MPVERDSFAPEEGKGNLTVLPSRVTNKRFRVVSYETENETEARKRMNMMEAFGYPHNSTTEGQPSGYENRQYNTVNHDIDSKQAPKSCCTQSPLPKSSIGQHHHLLSCHHKPGHIYHQTKHPTALSKLRAFSSSITTSPDLSSSSDPFKQVQSTSTNLALQCKLKHFPLALTKGSSSSQMPPESIFKPAIDGKNNLHTDKTKGLILSAGPSSMFHSDIPSRQLSRQSTFKSSIDEEIDHSKNRTNGINLSDCSSLQIKPELPSSQIPIKPTFKTTVDKSFNLSPVKSKGDEGEQLDTHLSLGSSVTRTREIPSSRSTSKEASSSKLQIHVSQGNGKRPRQAYASSISRLGIPRDQLITPMRYSNNIDQQIELLKQQNRSTTAKLDALRREALAQARKETLKRERLLKAHMEINSLLSKRTKAEDLLSQSLRMQTHSSQFSKIKEFMGKRSREDSWRKNMIKEYTHQRRFMKESALNEIFKTRVLSSRSSRREAPISESLWSKCLLASKRKIPLEANFRPITSQGAKIFTFGSGSQKGELTSVPSSTGTKEKEKPKGIHIKSIPKELGRSFSFSPSNLQHHIRSTHNMVSSSSDGPPPREIDLNLRLQMPSTSSGPPTEN